MGNYDYSYPPTHETPTLTGIARLLPLEPAAPQRSGKTEVIVLDYINQPDPVQEQALIGESGLWLRHPHPFVVGTPVRLHVIVADNFTPVTLEGTVAKVRRNDSLGNPWMLVWLSPRRAESRKTLVNALRQRQM